MITKGLRAMDWQTRDYYRAKGLQDKIRNIPGGGAVFSTQIDPVMQAIMRSGFKIDLTSIRATLTNMADTEIKTALGDDLTSVFPKNGMVALMAAPKIKAMVKQK